MTQGPSRAENARMAARSRKGWVGVVLLGWPTYFGCHRQTESAPVEEPPAAAPVTVVDAAAPAPEIPPWARDAAAGPPSPERMRPALAPIYAEVKRCLKATPRVDGGGAMELHITAVGTGRIVGAELAGPPDLRACVEPSVRKLSLPAFSGQAIEMRIPLLASGDPMLLPPDGGAAADAGRRAR